MNIYLAGMIGTGKTTVGRALAECLEWSFDELDDAMARMAGKSFRQVVAEEGWLGFRQREYSICKGFARLDRTVIGLGGGTVRYEWNRDVLRGTGINILLVAENKVLAERIRDNDRPRVHPGTTMEQDLALIWDQYKDLYYNFADLVYRTDLGKSVEEETAEILFLSKLKGGPEK